MKKAIVFAGGGSKGAYQVGAWKALNELGQSFQIAAGTSIGSINAAFYVQHDFDAAYEMWGELTAGAIMTNGINMDRSFESIFSQRDQLVPFIKNYITSKGADVTPFHERLRSFFSEEKFFTSEVDYALVTTEFPSMDPVVVRKADMRADPANAWQWLAASAACFPVFPVMEIGGKSYVDGGYYDNIPVAPAFSLGADEVVVVDLKTENNHEGYLRHPRVKYIKPSRDLGTFMNFEREVLDRSIRLGYNDTMKAYGRYYGTLYTFVPGADESYYRELAALFMTLMTRMEADYDFSGTVRFQRINKSPGCATLLAERCPRGQEDEFHLFFAALELYLRLLEKDDKPEYPLDDLLYELKSDVDGMYPMLEFSAADAFDRVRRFAAEQTGKNNPELKRFEDIRYAIVITSVARALQQTGCGTAAEPVPRQPREEEPMPSAIFDALKGDLPLEAPAAEEPVKEEETV
ncbi:MAG: patatin-like phospholipase family protein [Clostridia bacterium]|nr:patatin-like phospholipase family protein [Clostridia bacterium]